jgi:hypothetical protein
MSVVKDTRYQPKPTFLLTKSEYIAAVKSLYDAIYYSSRGIGIQIESIHLQSIMGTCDLKECARRLIYQVTNPVVSSSKTKKLQDAVQAKYSKPLPEYIAYFRSYMTITPAEEVKHEVDEDGDTKMQDSEDEPIIVSQPSKPTDQQRSVNEIYCSYLTLCTTKCIQAEPIESFTQRKSQHTITKIQEEIEEVKKLADVATDYYHDHTKPKPYQGDIKIPCPTITTSAMDELLDQHSDSSFDPFEFAVPSTTKHRLQQTITKEEPTPIPSKADLHIISNIIEHNKVVELKEESNPFGLEFYDHHPSHICTTYQPPTLTLEDINQERRNINQLKIRLDSKTAKQNKSQYWRQFPVQPYGIQEDYELQEPSPPAPVLLPQPTPAPRKSTKLYHDPYEYQNPTSPTSQPQPFDDVPIVADLTFDQNENVRVQKEKYQTIQYAEYKQDPISGDYYLETAEHKRRGRPTLPPEQRKYQKKYDRPGRPTKHTCLSILNETPEPSIMNIKDTGRLETIDELNDTIFVEPVSPPSRPSTRYSAPRSLSQRSKFGTRRYNSTKNIYQPLKHGSIDLELTGGAMRGHYFNAIRAARMRGRGRGRGRGAAPAPAPVGLPPPPPIPAMLHPPAPPPPARTFPHPPIPVLPLGGLPVNVRRPFEDANLRNRSLRFGTPPPGDLPYTRLSTVQQQREQAQLRFAEQYEARRQAERDQRITDIYNQQFPGARKTRVELEREMELDELIIARVREKIFDSVLPMQHWVARDLVDNTQYFVYRKHVPIWKRVNFAYTGIRFNWAYIEEEPYYDDWIRMTGENGEGMRRFLIEIFARAQPVKYRMWLAFTVDGERRTKPTHYMFDFHDVWERMAQFCAELDTTYAGSYVEAEWFEINVMNQPDDLTGGLTPKKIQERLDKIRKDWLIVNPHSSTNCLWTAIAICDSFEGNSDMLWKWKIQNAAGSKLKRLVGTRNHKAGNEEDLQKCADYKQKQIDVYDDLMELKITFLPTTIDEKEPDEEELDTLRLLLLRGHYHAMLPKTSPIVTEFQEKLPMVKERPLQPIKPVDPTYKFANRRIVVYDLESWRDPIDKLVELPREDFRIDTEIHQRAYACGWAFEIYRDEKLEIAYNERDLNYAQTHDYKIIDVFLLGEWKKFAYKQHLGENCLNDSLNEWLTNSIFHDAVFYAHNGGKFDIRLILGQSDLLYSETYNIVADRTVELNGRIISMHIENRELDYKTKNNRRVKHCISIRDDIPLFGIGPGSSLDKLGKDLKTPHKKLAEKVGIHEQMFEHTWREIWEREGMNEYFENDVMCLIEVLYMFNDVCMSQCGIPITAVNTGASLAKKYYLKHFYHCYFPDSKDFQKTKTIYTLSADMDLFIRKSYGGGRCEAFVSREIQDNLFYYDFTSLYPDVARYDLPIGMPRWLCPPDQELNHAKVQAVWKLRIQERKTFGQQYFWKVMVISPKAKIGMPTDPLYRKPLFGVKENNMYLFRWFEDWTELTLYEPEILYGIDHGLDYDFYPVNAITFYKSPCLKDCMEQLFVKKAQAKEQGHEALEKTWKIIINSLYGVWGLKVLDREGIEISKPEYSNWAIDLVTEKLMDIEKIGQYVVTRRSKDLEVKDCNVAIASAITSYARMKLYSLFMDVQDHGGVIYYCDTDSIICNICIERESDMNHRWIGNTNGKGLGTLKNEIVECIEKYNKDHPDEPIHPTFGFDKAVIVAPKVYIVADKTCKIVKKAHKGYKENKEGGDVVTYERLQKLVDKTLPEEQRCMVQKTIQWLGGNADIVKNNIGVRLVERTKFMRQTVNKGILQENGDIRPHQVKPVK